MKNLVSLIVAMLLCVGVYAQQGQKGGQSILNTGISVQLGIANTAAIDQSRTDFSQAAIGQVGLHNVGYVQQIGKKNDAGVWAKPMLRDVCSSSLTCLFDVAVKPTIENVGMHFNLICGEPVCVGDIVAELPVFATGLYQAGAFNLGSIVQHGKENKGGVLQVGLANAAGLQQFGRSNKGFINQVGAFNSSVVSQQGSKNIALVDVKGIANKTIVEQDCKENKAVQIVEGFKNTAIVDQLGCKNTAIQAIDGGFNFVLSNQKGAYNRSVQTVEGCMNVNEVFQVGIANNAYIEQGIPESVDWSGIRSCVRPMNRDDYLGGCLHVMPVSISAPSLSH